MLGKRLKTARNNAKLTQVDVAAYLNIIRQTYSAYETGRSTPNPETLNMLSKLYDVSTDWLLGNVDDPTPANKKKRPEPIIDSEQEKEVLKLQKLANELSIEDIKSLIKFAISLKYQHDE